MDPERQQDPIDKLLARARWNEPDPAAIARLRASVLRSSPPLVTTWRIAAAILLATAGGVMWKLWSRESEIQRGNPIQVVQAVRRLDRPPTAVEAGLWRIADRRDKARATTRASAPKIAAASPLPAPRVVERPKPLPQKVDLAAVRSLLARVTDPKTRDVAIAQARRESNPPIEALIAMLNDSLAENRVASARLLGAIDGPVLTRRLATMVVQDRNRREAMLALAFSQGAEARAFISSASERGPLASLARSALLQTRS